MTTQRPGRTSAIASMPAYRPHRPMARVDLSDNTCLWGPPPSVRETLASLTDAQLSRYPTPYADALCDAIASHVGVTSDRVVTGCGSDDVLDSAMRACCDAGGTIAIAVPTFSVVGAFAAVNDLAVTEVPMRGGARVLADDLLETGAQLYYLCSPNNPTGSVVDPGELERLCGATTATVLVDEAYVDFASASALPLLDVHRNLVVVRTLSKAYGLAGLRVGYALGDPGVVAAIAASRGPYKVGGVAEALAISVLRCDGAWVDERVADVVALRDGFAQRLRDEGLEVLGSSANFVAVAVDDAADVLERMLARGVLVRAYPALPVVGDLIRITIGPAPMLDEALDALLAAVR